MFDFSKYLDWIKLSPRYLLPIVLFTGFVLFAPAWLLDTFGLTELLDSYRPIFGLVFLLSSALLITSLVLGGFDWIKSQRRAKQARKELRQRLHRLSEPEKEILRGYVHNSTTTLYLPMSDGVVGGLEAQRILYRSSNIGDLDEWAYNIQPWAWEYLNDHPELLDAVTNGSNIT